MKKLFILFIIIAIPLYASTMTTYEINAYKFTESTLSMNVYSTLSGSLDALGNSTAEKTSAIDLSSYAQELMHSEYEIQDFNQHQLFSALVIGKLSLNSSDTNTYSYSLLFSLGAFINDDDSSGIIPVHYEIGNYDMTHTAGEKISTSETTGYPQSITVSSTTPQSLSFSWTLQRSEESASISIPFEARCGVAALINNNDYDAAPIGSYTATVTVTLEVN